MGAYSLFYEFVRGVLTPHTALGRTSARLQLHAPTPQVSQQGFSSVSHFVDLLRSSNTSRIMHKRAWRLFDLSWNKTSPGDDGSFFLRAQVTYVSAAAAKGAHVYFLCTDTLTHDMELLFRNASLDATTGNLRHQQASPEVLRRSTLSAEAAWYIRSLFAADWALVQRHCPRRF